MEIKRKDVSAELAVKIEKVMAKTGKTWEEAVVFLLERVVSPKPKFVKA